MKKQHKALLFLVVFFILGFATATLAFYKPSFTFPSTVVTADNAELVPLVDRNFFDTAVAEINNAQQSIDLAMFQFKTYDSNNQVMKLQQALVDAAARGVQIRVLLDQSNWNKGIKEDNEPTVNYFLENGIQARFDNPKTTLHVKIWVIDNNVIIGSTNLGFHALERNNEASVLIRNAELAEYYRNYFETLWNYS